MKLLLPCVVALSTVVEFASAHGGLFIPAPRNSEDNVLPEFAGGKSPVTACTCTNGNGDNKKGCDRGLRGAADGQNCLWWSQGCSIGCKECATEALPHGPFHGKAPQSGKIGFNTRYCNATFNSAGAPAPLINSTLPKHAWTLNLQAEEGSEEDVYKYNPWRAPGYAPVVDPCGIAGGEHPHQGIGGDSVFYKRTVNGHTADYGDKGSLLPPSALRPKWKRGTQVEVAWGPRYNHGGGYSYRLCSADNELTEECFQKTPLAFDKTKQTLVWNTKDVPGRSALTPANPANGTLRYPVPNPVFVDEGTWPKGSMWARDPIPRVEDGNQGRPDAKACPGPNGRSGPGCLEFPPPCPWDVKENGVQHLFNYTTDGDGMGACSSDWVVGLISDEVIIPKDLKPGHWVLSWRWDCEETAQIWQNCADVEIV